MNTNKFIFLGIAAFLIGISFDAGAKELGVVRADCPVGSLARKAEITYMDVEYTNNGISDFVTKEFRFSCYNPSLKRYVKTFELKARRDFSDFFPWNVFDKAKIIESLECKENETIESLANTDRDTESDHLLYCMSADSIRPRSGFKFIEDTRDFLAKTKRGSDKGWILRDYAVLIFENIENMTLRGLQKAANDCLLKVGNEQLQRINATAEEIEAFWKNLKTSDPLYQDMVAVCQQENQQLEQMTKALEPVKLLTDSDHVREK